MSILNRNRQLGWHRSAVVLAGVEMQPSRGKKETGLSGFQQNHREVSLVPQVKAGFPQLSHPSFRGGSGLAGSWVPLSCCPPTACMGCWQLSSSSWGHLEMLSERAVEK